METVGTVYSVQRRNVRSTYRETLEIMLPSHGGNNHSGSLIAIASNISDGGICIYTFKSLSEGDGIVFRNYLPVPYQRANVIWVRQCNPSIYKAGAKFTA